MCVIFVVRIIFLRLLYLVDTTTEKFKSGKWTFVCALLNWIVVDLIQYIIKISNAKDVINWYYYWTWNVLVETYHDLPQFTQVRQDLQGRPYHTTFFLSSFFIFVISICRIGKHLDWATARMSETMASTVRYGLIIEMLRSLISTPSYLMKYHRFYVWTYR